jgi:hypothetical protein
MACIGRVATVAHQTEQAEHAHAQAQVQELKRGGGGGRCRHRRDGGDHGGGAELRPRRRRPGQAAATVTAGRGRGPGPGVQQCRLTVGVSRSLFEKLPGPRGVMFRPQYASGRRPAPYGRLRLGFDSEPGGPWQKQEARTSLRGFEVYEASRLRSKIEILPLPEEKRAVQAKNHQ